MKTPVVSLCSIAAVALVVALGPKVARADVPPPDACTSPGQPCQNAGPQYDQAGTCSMTTCTRQVPAPDGGTMSMTYDCNLCRAGDGGGGGGSGCSVVPGPSPRARAAGAVLLVLSLVSGLARAAVRRRAPRA